MVEVCGCFWRRLTHVGPVSLNRTEQMTFDYLEGQPDERHFWLEKVRTIARQTPDAHEAASRLEVELWHYVVERSAVVSPFREQAGREGLPRTSMRNLADHLLRLWTEPRPKPKKKPSDY
jgi:hypothetical protein